MKKYNRISRNLLIVSVILLLILLLSFMNLTSISKHTTNYSEDNDTKNESISDTSDSDTLDNEVLDDSFSDSELTNEENVSNEYNNNYLETPSLSPLDITEHGKSVNVYGDISPEDERVAELNNLLSGYGKNISIAALRKDGSKGLSYNTEQTYFSACTIKIGYILSCCKQIDAGLFSKDTVLTYQERHYHRGSGQIRNSPYGSTYTVEYLITQCLSISDNVAYTMLAEHFGYDYYNNMVNELGCTSINLNGLWGRNVKTTDYIIIWNEVYDYFNSGTEMAQLLKKSCTNTPFNYGTISIDADYSHKSGDNFGQLATYSDAGIVWADNSPYIFAVFTNSEGTYTDSSLVNSAMQIVYNLMTQ